MLKAEKFEVKKIYIMKKKKKIYIMLIIFPSGHDPDFQEYLPHGCICCVRT